jgi:hypothetical protein
MSTSVEEAKAAMRQKETIPELNRSGGEAQRVRSPWTTPGSVTSTPASLGIHGQPNTNRQRK